MIRQCLSEWFGSNSHSTWDIFIHTNWSGGLVHRLPSGFTIPPACTILWTCWTVMIKLSGSLPEALFFLDTRRLKVLEQQSRPGCFSQQTKTNLMSSRAQTPLTLTSVTCSSWRVWPQLETRFDNTITHSLTQDCCTRCHYIIYHQLVRRG